MGAGEETNPVLRTGKASEPRQRNTWHASSVCLPRANLGTYGVDTTDEPPKLPLFKLLNTDSINHTSLKSLKSSGPF